MEPNPIVRQQEWSNSKKNGKLQFCERKNENEN
jgi:hypothetical protein